MSLATRCSTCGTTFRVVQDQLKVSEGWVRCGRCEAVFNAVGELFDLEREAPEHQRVEPPRTSVVPAAPVPPPMQPLRRTGSEAAVPRNPIPLPDAAPARAPAALPPSPGPAAPPAATATPTPPPVAAPTPPRPPPSAAPAAPADTALPETAPEDPDSDPPVLVQRQGPKPAGAVGPRDRLEFSDARFDSDLFEEDPAGTEVDGETAATAPVALPLESERAPDFLRRAERRPRWQPASTPGLGGALFAVAALVLVSQVAVHHRAAIASAWPWTHGPLDAACAVAGCTVEAPRRIDALTVESTALARAVSQDGFVLTVAVRNRSAAALVTPSVDLTLTDGSGRLVARRALGPGDLHAAATVPAGADVQLQTALDVRGVRVAGYTVEIFYP